jgi:PAS domain S-box-containing protein
LEDYGRTRDELITELEGLQRRIAELEASDMDRQRAEEALRESEDLYSKLVKISPSAVTVTDLEGNITYVSPKALEQNNAASPKDLLGKNAFEFIAPEDREKAVDNLQRTLNEDYSGPVVYTMFRSDGSRFVAELNAALLKDARGNPKAFVAFTRDITERKKMEEELQARNEELEAFSHTISHDLRTPLAVIEGYAKTVLESKGEERSEAERECLESIIRGSQRISRMIESLLAYASMGRPEGESVLVMPGDIIQEVLLEHDSIIRDKGVEIEVHTDLPLISVDPIKLRQVLANLLDNAIKYMGEANQQPRVEIGAVKEGDMARFYVRDNGIGIPPEDSEAIFEPFTRLSITDPPGLGIGLSTVKRAVAAWGGELWMESQPGQGSTFYFTAPAWEGEFM